MKEENICYPYAYGRLKSGIDMLVLQLEWECSKKDIEIDDKVVDMLQQMIENLQEKAAVESYDMKEEENICYPYAYGRLESGIDLIVNHCLQWECMKKDIEIDDKVVDMLNEMIENLQEKAAVESYEYS